MNNNKIHPGVSQPSQIDAAYTLTSLLYQSLINQQVAGDFYDNLAEQLSVEVTSLAFEIEGAVVNYGADPAADLFATQHSASAATGFEREKGTTKQLEIYPLQKHQEKPLSIEGRTGQPGIQYWSLAWRNSSISVELVIEPKNPRFDPLAFVNRHRELLDYLCPHLPAAYSIFQKQQVRAPRLNGLRALHAMLPLPLVIVRPLERSLFANTQALRLMNTKDPQPRCDDKLHGGISSRWRVQRTSRDLQSGEPAAGTTLPWIGDATAARQLPAVNRLPTYNLPWLRLGTLRGTYEVHLLSAPGTTSVNINGGLLMTCFGLSAAEARICASAMEGRNPRDIAAQLGISINTVKARLKSIYRAIGVRSVAQLSTQLYFHPAFWAANYGQQAPARCIPSI